MSAQEDFIVDWVKDPADRMAARRDLEALLGGGEAKAGHLLDEQLVSPREAAGMMKDVLELAREDAAAILVMVGGKPNGEGMLDLIGDALKAYELSKNRLDTDDVVAIVEEMKADITDSAIQAYGKRLHDAIIRARAK